MKLLLLLFALITPSLSATTYFIRPTDGGTPAQCTGTTNAAYPGSGSGVACAYKTIMYMVTNNTSAAAFAWRSVANDTVQYGENATADVVGFGPFLGLGINILACAGDQFDCFPPPPPNGTHILGVNAGSCSNPFTSGNRIYGINATLTTLDIEGTNNVDIECLILTMPANCRVAGSGPTCTAGTDSFAKWGMQFQTLGTTNQGPSNFTIKDVAIVGFAGDGILGSRINTSTSDVSTFSNVYVIGNGQAGIDSDSGSCGTGCENIGTLNITGLDVEWNGCVAVKPFTTQASIAYNLCFDQNTGGYGDGLVFIASNVFTVNITKSFFKFNTQDGLDALHISDDLTHAVSVNVTKSWAEGNEGQTFKIGTTSGVSTLINNVSINNCAVLGTASNFPANPTGWNTNLTTLCRASDGMAFQMNNGATIDIENNTSVVYNSTAYDFACAAGGTCTTGIVAVMKNNITLGLHSGSDPGGIFLASWTGSSGNPFTNTGGAATNNLWFGMSFGSCPSVVQTNFSSVSIGETSCQIASPLLVAQSNINAINPNLTSSSPAIGAGTFLAGVTTDYNGVTRPNPPSEGAFEFAGAPTLTTITVLPNPGSVVTSSTINFQTSSFCTFSDSSTIAAGSTGCVVVWTDTGAHSTINSSTGVATGVSAGSDTVTATLSPATPGTATLNVTTPATTNKIKGGKVTAGGKLVMQ